ncbi:MAG: aminopeptidase P family protein [Desulfobacteraceae bacterium]|nr:aminopeptidase P family protein [Desulfobacteraceae bacterium]
MMTKLQKTPDQEIKNRICVLKQEMEANDIDAVFLTHKPDIFYFSGTSQDCYLYLHLNHDPVLFVRRYFPRAKEESPLKDIFQILSIKQFPEKIQHLHKKLPKVCGLTFDVVPVRDYHFYQTLFSATTFVDATAIVNTCKQIKSSYEIEQMKLAATLSEKTFVFIRDHIRPGISEMEFSGEYETFARKFGHSGILLNRYYRSVGYVFHLLSGKNGGIIGAVDTPCCGIGTSSTHPFGASAKIIHKNEPIFIDFGTILNGYHMDETRMFVIGNMEQRAMDASKASIEILHDLVSLMKPGVIMSEVFEKSVFYAKKLGYDTQFLGPPDSKCVFIGHSIGLELVESPIISKGNKDILKPGMVFAVEPKFSFKNEFAAGIESVIQITKKGARFLSMTPHEVFVC